ncbi:Serine/threonine-protein kinase Nek4 [Cichlidogyrus casuarinus]|uniref:non-specific serine/threonine protein kinase n=1 Tax=Cichlidogyrus casuarinus TaxID=1844966 RepID=A0ABD2PPU7_9PLAT
MSKDEKQERSIGRYTLVKTIGKGSYGEVWLCKNEELKQVCVIQVLYKLIQYVMKKINLKKAGEKERKAAHLECTLLAELKHPNIVPYKDSFDYRGYLYIIMGYCEGGDLYNRLKDQHGVFLDEIQIVEWFVQIAIALQYMHERNILHRDLKTQNIFLTKSKIIKVGDLGIARVLDDPNAMATTMIGTPYYMSPELYSNRPYNHKSDIWALGCITYEMASLKHAFNAQDFNSLSYKILSGKMPNMPQQYSTELLDLIKSMLNKKPEKRPSARRIISDPFIRKHILLFLEATKNRSTRASSGGKERTRPQPVFARPQHQQPEIAIVPQQADMNESAARLRRREQRQEELKLMSKSSFRFF